MLSKGFHLTNCIFELTSNSLCAQQMSILCSKLDSHTVLWLTDAE